MMMEDGDEYSPSDLRAIVRARDLDLAAACKQRDRGDAQLREMKQVLARLRAVNGALLADKTHHVDQLDRVRDLEDQAHRWADGQQRLEVKGSSEREAKLRNDLSVACVQLEAATARITDLQARVAELESAPAPSGAQSTGPDGADLVAGGADDVGFTVTAAAARRIADLVQQLTGVRTASFGAADMLELGLSNSVTARRDMDACYAHLRTVLDGCYRGQPRHTDWGALLAATLSDVVFAGDLLSKAWTETVQAMHELVAPDDQPPDAAAFPVSVRAGCLLSYVRMHLPVLAEDVRAARVSGHNRAAQGPARRDRGHGPAAGARGGGGGARGGDGHDADEDQHGGGPGMPEHYSMGP
jgi:hypothetical protein